MKFSSDPGITRVCARLLLVVLAGCVRADAVAPATAGPSSVQVAPSSGWNLEFVDISGQKHRLVADPAVKAIVLIFVLPDCPIGNSYMPELERMHADFAALGLQFVLVHADPATTIEQARAHAEEYRVQMPVVLDVEHRWVRAAGATTAPEAAVFSRGGELLYRGRIDDQYAGLGKRRAVVTEHTLADALEAILAGESVKEPRMEAVGCLIPDLPSGK